MASIGSINGVYGKKYSSQSVANAVHTGRVSFFDLTEYITPVGDEKSAWVTNVNFGTSGVFVEGKNYNIRYCELTFTPSKNIGLPLLYGAVNLFGEVATAENQINRTQFRFKTTEKYYCSEAQLNKDSIVVQTGFHNDNKKQPYNSSLDYVISGTSLQGSVSNSGVIFFLYTTENATFISGSVIDTSLDYYTARIRLTCLSDYPDGKINIDVKTDASGDDSTAGGYGGGSFDDSSDDFGIPELPNIGISNAGFVNVYAISANELSGFGEKLFPDFDLPQPSSASGLEAISENLANTVDVIADFANSYINAGLVNYVIDCHIVPVVPAREPNSGLKVGFKTFNFNPDKITSDYVEFDCGSVQISEYYQNFLDYNGTRAKLYLPFVGFVDVLPEWFQSGKLGIKYHFNVIDGSFIAFIIATSSKSKLKDTVVATYGGNCCVHMPITGINYSAMISGVVSGVSSTFTASKNGVGSAVSQGISSLADVMTNKPAVQQSNGYNAGMSFMAYRTPYLLIERPVASYSGKYAHENGLPLNVEYPLNSLSGFTICDNPILDSLKILPEERDMLLEKMQTGIIL